MFLHSRYKEEEGVWFLFMLGLIGCTLVLAVAGANNGECPNLSMLEPEQNKRAQDLDCAAYMRQRVGVQGMFMDIQHGNIAMCSDLDKLGPSLSTTQLYNCSCAAGFTDELADKHTPGSGLGILQNLQHRDLKYVTCGLKCPAVYENVMKVYDAAACACLNSRGCVFETRALLGGTSPNTKLSNQVLVLPDDLRMESSIIECTHLAYRQKIATRDVIACALNGIEYVYRNECPSECSSEDYDCQILPNEAGRCRVMCAAGFFQALTENGQPLCRPHLVCLPNHYHKYDRNSNGAVVLDSCAVCSIGSQNIHGMGEVCIACGQGKTNSIPASPCEPCPSDSILREVIPSRVHVPAHYVLQEPLVGAPVGLRALFYCPLTLGAWEGVFF